VKWGGGLKMRAFENKLIELSDARRETERQRDIMIFSQPNAWA
jgi:hypothetical protein